VLFLHKPGDSIAVDVVRGDQRLTATLTLTERPIDAGG
jgi:S1-C subfamily serine protease